MKIVFVLGMHRSGTSALTRAIALLGSQLPGNLMEPCADNELGYWESRDVARINNQVLEKLGASWKDYRPIANRLARLECELDHEQRRMREFLSEFQAENLPLVVKDPRLCLLMPLWQSAATSVGASTRHVLIYRDPAAVSISLQRRASMRQFRPAAIQSPSHTDLLWARYVLDAEAHTRDKDRLLISYEELIAEPSRVLQSLQKCLAFDASPDREILAAESIVSPTRKYDQPDVEQPISRKIYNCLKNGALREELDSIRAAIDASVVVEGNAHQRLVKELQSNRVGHPNPRLRVLYISGAPNSKGHTYRVVHPVESLRKLGIDVAWIDLSVPLPVRSLQGLDAVIIYRAEWSDSLKEIYDYCERSGIPRIFDVDDLVFDPGLIEDGSVHFITELPAPKRDAWIQRFRRYRETLVRSDFATVTSQKIVDAAGVLGVPASIVPNGIGQWMLDASKSAVDSLPKSATQTECVCIGYASGTPTHQKDFAQIEAVLASLFQENQLLRLKIVGHLQLSPRSPLVSHFERIDFHKAVPHGELFTHYRMFDINLAPLEIGNRFCEAKSALKYHEPALVETPTIAAATEPYRAAIVQGKTGFCARNAEEWAHYLRMLIRDSTARSDIGQRARSHVTDKLGAQAQGALLSSILNGVIRRKHVRLPDTERDP